MEKTQYMKIVIDIEADGLLDTITKIHCLSYYDIDKKEIKSLTNYQDMINLLSQDKLSIIGHNITLYDIPALEKVLNIKIKAKLFDTLGLSWYLYPERNKHGLESWGKDFGILKVEIKDWSNQSIKDYTHRCEEDVKINTKLWYREINSLSEIYDHDKFEMNRFIEYLQFKLDCVREQETIKIKLDIPHIEETLRKAKQEKFEKEEVLRTAMPQVPVKTTKVYKDVIVLENGEFFERGDMMFDHYFREGFRPKMEHTVESIRSYRDPNPNSNDQKKAWLFSLGWNPITFEHKKNPDGTQRKIPQIASPKKDGYVCDSIKALFTKEPRLEVLEGLSVLSHRIGILEGFISNQKDGYIEASMGGLTNTLRLKHTGVNIYSPYKTTQIAGKSLSYINYNIVCKNKCESYKNNIDYLNFTYTLRLMENQQPSYHINSIW